MDRRQALKILSLGAFLNSASASLALASTSNKEKLNKNDAYKLKEQSGVYLMAYFKSSNQQLFYAYSTDCRNWIPLNRDSPVMKNDVDLRDPFIGRVNGVFHLVHTKGWDYPVIYHYTSNNLIHWEGGQIQVVSAEKKRAWAPEWFYEEKEGIFYVFWASLHNGHNAIYYTKTKDWKDIRPETSKVYYDLGIDDIDFTVTKINHGPKPGYYAFHKPGSLEDNFPIRCMYSSTLDPVDSNFNFGSQKHPSPTLPPMVKPIEGPEIIQLNHENKWYIYADPFHQPFVGWETTDFKTFEPIIIKPPEASKHCSILHITLTELNQLKIQFPIK